MSQCPYCHRTEHQVKAGRNESGTQRYKCKGCERKYTPEPKLQGYSEAVRRQALQLYVDGMNFRRIARTLNITHRSVINWVNAYGAQVPDAPPVPDEDLDVNELDELFTFVGQKKTKPTS
jgi:transposase